MSKGYIQEFKEFAVKGNVIDLAVGVVIGIAFGKITTSVVNDVIMPVIGYLTGGISFSEKEFVLPAVIEGTQSATIKYGVLVDSLLNFLIVAMTMFIVVKMVNNLKRKQVAAPAQGAPLSEEVALLTEIRDALKGGKASTVKKTSTKKKAATKKTAK